MAPAFKLALGAGAAAIAVAASLLGGAQASPIKSLVTRQRADLVIGLLRIIGIFTEDQAINAWVSPASTDRPTARSPLT